MERDVKTASEIDKLSDNDRKFFVGCMDPETWLEYEASWHHWARDEQLAPMGDWTVWLVMAGRGFGKTLLARNGCVILPNISYAREDRRGLRVIGSVSTKMTGGREVAMVLKRGAIKGLSFGYRVKRATDQKPRELLDLDIVEISLVTLPMQPLATVHLLD